MAIRILVPLDGSKLSECVFRHLREWVRSGDSEIILIRVEEALPVAGAEGFYAQFPTESLASIRTYLRKVQDRLAREGLRVSTIARAGSPGSMILEVAKEESVSLIAMATHGRSGLERFLMGSVSEQVLRSAPVPVLLVRPFALRSIAYRAETRRMRNILLPIEYRDSSHAVEPYAAEFATLFGARVVLLQVIDPSVDTDGESDLQDHLEDEVQYFTKRRIPTRVLQERGDPAKIIFEMTRLHRIDLIAMSTHGRKGLSRLLGGSVTEKVLRQATVPMLVVRRELARSRAKRVGARR